MLPSRDVAKKAFHGLPSVNATVRIMNSLATDVVSSPNWFGKMWPCLAKSTIESESSYVAENISWLTRRQGKEY